MTKLFLPAQQVPLASKTTLELGGNAQYLIEAFDQQTVLQALKWAKIQDLSVTVLGGGSNVVIADQGIAGLVLCMRTRGIKLSLQRQQVLITVQAGEPWDEFVAYTVAHHFAGLECLSGIPGLCGASPIQNVGAYGQEVADTIQEIQVIDRDTLTIHSLPKENCAFSYRTSVFKKQPEKYVVLSVTFRLQANGTPTMHYAELEQALVEQKKSISLSNVRETVLALRRKKSMVIDTQDENRRSVGSFFLNPILDKEAVQTVVENAMKRGVIHTEQDMPTYAVSDTQVKLSAAWLIERSGIHKGQRFEQFGISSKHSLCLVHYGQGKAADLIRTARWIQCTVFDQFQVRLHPEPNFLGFSAADLQSLFSKELSD